MRDSILILEDDSSRLRRLHDVLSKQHSQFSVYHWRDANQMIRELPRYMSSAALFCLDHDLYPLEAEAPDPGDGLDVARHLAQLPPCCPVIIHSSNSDRSRMMLGELQLAGWICRRVIPVGDDWVEADWSAVVRDLMGGHE